jgi:DNA polymerase III epsilon subunit family exonuclease
MREYIAIDVETTGLNNQYDRICEIAAVRFSEDGQEISRFQSLVHPQCIISDQLIAIHGITNEDVQDAPRFEHVFGEFVNFLFEVDTRRDGSLVMAHNAGFDVGFINEEINRFTDKVSYITHVVDTLSLARYKYRFFPNHRLGTLAEKLELPKHDVHRALGDCLTLKDVWVKSQFHLEHESRYRKYRISNR